MTAPSNLTPLVHQIVDKYIKNHDETPGSEWVTKKLLKDHPDAVRQYVNNHLEQLIRGYVVTKSLGAKRSTMARQAARGLTDDQAPPVDIMSAPVHIPGVGYKQVGNMTADDHLAVAQAYERIHSVANRRAELHRTIAKKVGKKTTREVYTKDSLSAELRTAYHEERVTPISQVAN